VYVSTDITAQVRDTYTNEKYPTAFRYSDITKQIALRIWITALHQNSIKVLLELSVETRFFPLGSSHHFPPLILTATAQLSKISFRDLIQDYL